VLVAEMVEPESSPPGSFEHPGSETRNDAPSTKQSKRFKFFIVCLPIGWLSLPELARLRR
jgi:hypothetical protein